MHDSIQMSPTLMKILPSPQIARYLLEIGAVKLNVNEGFVWTSGIWSPIYCDNRIINSTVRVRDEVISEFTDKILQHYLQNTDIIAGVSTGGIPYGALIADRLKLPFIYVREKKKEHGLMKMIEGHFEPGNKVILIEDHISTGISSKRAVDALRDNGLQLISLISIMTYRFKEAENLFKDNNIEYNSLCDLDTILKVALEDRKLSQNEVDLILKFRDNHSSSVK